MTPIITLGIGLGLGAACVSWAWCLRRRNALRREDERMVEAARAGRDVSSWARTMEGQLGICRVDPETAKAAWGLGLIGEEAAKLASSPSYASAYALRAHGLPLVVAWAPAFACVMWALAAAGVSAPALLSCALALVVATGDAMFRSIPFAACVLMGVAGAFAWGAPLWSLMAFCAAVTALMGLSGGRGMLSGIGTGDLLLFLCMFFGVLGTGRVLVLPVAAVVLLVALLVYQRSTDRVVPVAVAPVLLAPYLLTWVVVACA